MPHPGKLGGEIGVLISLVVSLGMVVLTITGWWLWKILTAIAPSLSDLSLIEIP
ncbi:MAG: hypothetical protein HOP32_12265 [Nitrospira sp.]|nr:hypothetical protein [Nitrospira sp.]